MTTAAPTRPTPEFDSTPDRRGSGSLKWDKFAGTDVLPFWVADMDFTYPPEVLAAARQRVDHGVFGYGKIHPALVEATLGYLQREHGVTAAEESIVWLPGLVPALNMACRAVGSQGDAVITCSPVYPPFLGAPANADRRLTDVPLCVREGRWTFDFAAMEAAIRPDTKLFLLCNPHNPTGRVYDADEMAALYAFCQKHELVLCSDEIHCDLILDRDAKHRSAAAPDNPLPERTITLFAPSKTYNIAGLAFSLAVIPDPTLRAKFRRAGQGFLSEVNVVGQFAGEAAYRHGEPWRQELIAYLRGNRDALYAFAASDLPGVELLPMQSTYLAWMDVRSLGLDDPARFFEKAAKVGLSDGTFFGLPGFVRFNFGCSRTLMMEGLTRMAEALKTI